MSSVCDTWHSIKDNLIKGNVENKSNQRRRKNRKKAGIRNSKIITGVLAQWPLFPSLSLSLLPNTVFLSPSKEIEQVTTHWQNHD
jgi:hypothetical protein